MMKRFNFNAASKALLGAGLLSLVLAGCGGSDGTDGQDGAPGEPGLTTLSIDNATTLKADFTDASISNGSVSVTFSLTNANGVAVVGLTKDYDLRFGIAQLTHVVDTNSDGSTGFDHGYQWQSYINVTKAPSNVPTDVDNLNPSTQTQATVESVSNCDNCLVDNGDGTYTYTYQNNIANVTTPVSVTYDADDTQRVTLELKTDTLAVNAHFDWQPSSGMTSGIQTRNVVSIDACYTCHQPDSLKAHGGRRLDLANCEACHTATSGDPESGNSIDFTYMIHAIHRGSARVTYDADGNEVADPYKIVGYGGSVEDFSEVNFPQTPAADCSVCHVQGTNAPSDAALFTEEKSNTACIACHSEKPSAHHDSTDCMSCHNAESPYTGTGSAVKRHGDVLKAYTLAQEMSVKVSNIGLDANGKLTFGVQVLDADGNAVDQTYINQSSRMVVGWDIDKDFPAYSEASYSNRRASLSAGTYDAATKTYTVTMTSMNMPADASGKTFEIWSTLQACFNNGGYGVDDIQLTDCSADNVRKVYIKQDPYRFVWGDNGEDSSVTAATRRTIIDTTKCQGCHGEEIHHYDNGVNCQTCHTPDKPLISSSTYAGGKIPSSFMFKAHERDGHYLKYSGLGSGTVLKTDCETCHTSTGITLGRDPDRAWRYGDTANNGAEIWVSSDAGVCLSCHQQYLTDAAKSHIETNGGILDGSSISDVQQRAAETCKTCHTPSQLMEAHGN
ncbi:OmcA/MtrC family decaheme c-type cytochrome [Shewanella sp. A32]|uniref:OmcA/MtrC family decaheme c-type cytochrome n=1 Tax=Shewanella sp. A32 TaxID=3031327 RepID=UPI0023B95D3D|nr:OmcA/MtrC family decaheme c-type cytochrome [Shewanella sp. A32]MDF0534346.1 OmcA/MtrC family decaheme c-type cytochrome [Shewanella sp. A32]